MKIISLKIGYIKICLLAPLFLACIYSQTDTSEAVSDIYSEIIENSVDENEEESDNYLSVLEALRENPVDLNTADIFELQRLPYITPGKAEKILDYRRKYGKIFSVKELAGLEGFDPQTINDISPFVVIDLNTYKDKFTGSQQNGRRSDKWVAALRCRTIFPLQIKQGFKENKFTGTPVKNYNRLQIKFGSNADINFLSDKDEGENKINDFYSFNFRLKNYYFVQSLIVGDYYVESGQGLTLWGAYSNSIGTGISSAAVRNQKNIVPYTSSGEYGFLRGIAASFKLRNFNLSVFYSSKPVDANIDSSIGIITSFKQDGYHRTQTETAKKGNSNELLLGTVLEFYAKNFLKAGIIAARTSLNMPLKSKYGSPQNKFENYSFYYDLYLKAIRFSGEAAYDNKNIAMINNFYYLISSKVNSIVSFRYYSPFFGSLHGLGFGEGSSTNNEIGFYTGLSFNFSFGKVFFNFDTYTHPMPVYNSLFPTKGLTAAFSFLSGKFSDSEILLRYNYSKSEFKEDVNNISVMSEKLKNKLRVELKKYYGCMVLKSRIDYNWLKLNFNDLKDNGFMIMQDIQYNVLNYLKIYGRIIFFRSKSFDTAVYEFENDLEGLFKSCSLFGSGTRWYAILKLRLVNDVFLSVKYSETYKPDLTAIGTGNSQIDGNIDNMLGIQLDVRL